MIIDTISIKEQIDTKLEQLEVLTNHNLADISSVSQSSVTKYYEWILPIVFKWFKKIDDLTRFYDLYEMSSDNSKQFIIELFNMHMRNYKENKDCTGVVGYFQFISENGSLSIRKEIGKTLCKLNKGKLTELDISIRERYAKNPQILSHWEEVKDFAESTNPILNNIASIFRRKKKED